MSNVFDEHANNYSEGINEVLGKYGANHDFFMTHKAWLIKDLLRKHGRAPGEMHLLDVGCGTAKIHELIADDFADVTGIDVSQASLEVARQTYPNNNYVSYEGDRLPFPDNSFDLSMAICVLHHVPPEQWAALTTEMLRVLKPGGLCLVIEHNPNNPVTRRIVSTCELDKDAVLLRASKLKGLFRRAGGGEVFSRAILSVPPTNGFLKRIDGALGFLHLGAQYYTLSMKRSG